MPEPVDHQDTPPTSSSKPGDNSRRLKIRNWLIRIAVIVVLSTVVEKVIGHVSDNSLDKLTQVNDSFVKGVGQVNPFNLVSVFYSYLLEGEPREPPPTLYGFRMPRAPETPQIGSIPVILWRIIPGAFYTAKIIVSEGLVSTLTALVALFLGLASVWSGLKKKGSLSETLLVLLAVPLIGSVFVWLLIAIMLLAGLLFGRLLVGAQTIAWFGVVGTCINAVVKEQEHQVSGKIIARLTGQH
jgi:hypothetical protein